MIVGYILSGQDNGAHFYLEAPESTFCSSCDRVIDRSYFPERLARVRSRYPFSYTFDGQAIASRAFRDFSESADPGGLKFARVNSDPDLYWVNAQRVLEFDTNRRMTMFTSFCARCAHYAQVAGLTPGFLRAIKAPLPTEFFRTDVEFGSNKEQAPAIIVGPELKSKIERQKYKGVYFSPVYGVEPTEIRADRAKNAGNNSELLLPR